MSFILSTSFKHTHYVANVLGKLLTTQTAIGLIGDLGAGKTHFVQGIANGMGISQTPTSPTFTILSEYEGEIPLLHGDFYRVTVDDFTNLDLEDIIEEWEGVSIIEWADLFPEQLPVDVLWIKIEIVSENERSISAWSKSQHLQDLIHKWQGNV